MQPIADKIPGAAAQRPRIFYINKTDVFVTSR